MSFLGNFIKESKKKLTSAAKIVLPESVEIKLGITKPKAILQAKVGENLTPQQTIKAKEVIAKQDILPPKDVMGENLKQFKPFKKMVKGIQKQSLQDMATNSVLGFSGGLKNVGAKAVKVIVPKIVQEAKPIIQKTIEEVKPILNVSHYNIPEKSKQVINKVANEVKPMLEQVKGKVLKNTEVVEAAKMSEVLKKAISREATLKSEATLLKTRQHLAALAKGETITKEFIDTLRIVSAESTERGRQLQALGIGVDPGLGTIKTTIIKKLIDIGKGTDEIVNASKNVDFNNANQVTKFYRQFVKAKLPELIDEYRYINMLSSPKTQIVNAFSNLLQVSGLRPATRLASGVIDTIASKLTGKQQEYYIKQVPAYYKGVVNSFGEATKGLIDALKGKATIYRPDLSRIPSGSKLLRPFQYIPRLMEGVDVFFRKLATGGEMEALMSKGMTEAQAISKASSTAEELVFRKALDPSNKTGQGYVLSTVDKLTNAIYGLRVVPVVKWFIPFVQTPMNILKQGLEYSPLGISILAKNTSKIEQLGKAMVGSTIFAGAGWLALDDKTTWAVPTSEKEKNAFYDAEMQPYSIKVGDKWVSYARLGPIAYPMAMAAAIKFYLKDNPKSSTDTNLQKTTKVLTGIVQFFADQSYLQGLGDFIDASKGDVTAIGAALANVPSQLIPLSSLQRWVANLIDPIYRKAKTGVSVESIIQNLEKGIPILSKRLEAYQVPSGEPSKRQLPITNAISPIGITQENPQGKELFNLIEQTSKETKLATQQKEQQKTAVQAEYNRLITMPKEQAAKEFDILIKDNPDMAKSINSLIKENQKGLTPKDEVLLGLGVENGLRAKTIKNELDKLSTKEAKRDYYQSLIDKKIITKQVGEQLIYLINQ